MGDGKKWEDGRSEEEAKKEQHRLLWTSSSFCFTAPCMRPNATQLRKHHLSAAAAANGFTAAGVFVGIGHPTRRQRRFLLLLLLSVLFFSVTFTFTFGFWTFQSDESIFAPPYYKLEKFASTTAEWTKEPNGKEEGIYAKKAKTNRAGNATEIVPNVTSTFAVPSRHSVADLPACADYPPGLIGPIPVWMDGPGFETEFIIEFKNIHLKCRAKFANSSIRFLVADPSPGEAENVQQKLEEEQRKHCDLVLLHGFTDIYRHIHLKWYGGLKWQQLFCAGAKWVMKADDDTIVHLQRLAHWTENKFNKIAEQNPLVQFGIVHYSAKPIRDPNNKWFVSTDEFPADLYPNYLSGGVYLSTASAISAILANTHESDGFYMDDVLFTGILAERANVTLSDQRAHFVWATSFDFKNAFCENGVPTAFSMWGAEVPEDFEKHYGTNIVEIDQHCRKPTAP
ncbi:hypothetical protein niasHT_025842 [Heterodera trifolii]|uniref:Hexosyltransferase n=1 Tax=Heterodera trifolii TaxID=157864 RepID=A0ABD2KJL3_9BILA